MRSSLGPPTWRATVLRYEPAGKIDGKTSWREVDQHNHAVAYEEDEAIPPTRRVTRIADKNLPYGGTWDLRNPALGERLDPTDHGKWRGYNPVFRFVSRYVLGHHATINQYLKDVAVHFKEPANLQN